MLVNAHKPVLDPITASDLRRRRRREFADELVERAVWLLPEDRALIVAMYRDGVTARELAELRSESPRVVRRRIRALVQRMLSPRFSYALVRRDVFSPTRRRVATACVLQGRTLRQTAQHLRMTLHAVRRHMDAIHAVLEAGRS